MLNDQIQRWGSVVRSGIHRPADSEAIRAAVRNALAEGFTGGVTIDGEGRIEGRVALPDRIADTVDLDALRADYEAWFSAAGLLDAQPGLRSVVGYEDTVAELIGSAFDDLADRPTWSQHLWEIERYPTGTVDGGIKHGLVVGDDAATTCAFILGPPDRRPGSLVARPAVARAPSGRQAGS